MFPLPSTTTSFYIYNVVALTKFVYLSVISLMFGKTWRMHLIQLQICSLNKWMILSYTQTSTVLQKVLSFLLLKSVGKLIATCSLAQCVDGLSHSL